MVVNRPSGNGYADAQIERLRRVFDAHFGPIARRVFAVTENHEQVYHAAREFLAAARGPCLLLAGGGGGTNRALAQALLETVERGAVRLEDALVGALRMGSGNLAPSHFGLPRDPCVALGRIAAGLFAGRTQPCCAYRCTLHGPDRMEQRLYGLTMAGLGQFGRVPDDIKRWRDRHPHAMRWLCRVAPLEAVNALQYLGFSLLRAAHCVLRPARAEPIEVDYAGRTECMRLLAGVLLNFDFPQMPIRGGCVIGEPRLALCLLPHDGRTRTLSSLLRWPSLSARARRYEIGPDRPVDIRFPQQRATVLALDEDTFAAPARIRFEVAGVLRFVTGAG